MDITTQKVANTAPIHLKDAAGELLYDNGNPVRIIVHGPGSDAYGLVESRQSARAVKRMQDNDGRISLAPHQTRIAETAEDLATITVAFEYLEYSPAGDAQGTELFAALYRDQSLGFITKQVTKFLADWGNFKPGLTAS